MASIFTFDPDPPRVSSPWSVSARQSPRLENEARVLEKSRAALSEDFEELHLSQLDDLHVTRLDAEPQEGPTEYKLHLLLRPRRSLSATTTSRHVSGSQLSHSPASSTRTLAHLDGSQPPPPLSSTATSRQHRLEQLTTQLLWRLQQSSPHHSSSATNTILPSIPDASAVLSAPQQPARLVPGLEESKGALYEIGVSDDGTFIGLTKDEMAESLNNLRAMAASLGCSVQVLRMVPVGECEWHDDEKLKLSTGLHRGRLYVAEAYVKPELKAGGEAAEEYSGAASQKPNSAWLEPAAHHVSTEQLRVSITGATTSGKSTLLGTLSTSTLDNARGKSRLSLLKHRHEIVSGMTSTVTQELIGYHDGSEQQPIQVINYGTKDVSSWNDIHAASSPGRLAFISDSAGHPRYRRTTVRGLVGWAPHWTLLCIAANGGSETETVPSFADQSFSGASAHLSMAHLDLCLRLQLPLIVVITKLDAANKTAFRQILSSLLSMLKAAGRKPVMLPNDQGVQEDSQLQQVSRTDAAQIRSLVELLQDDPTTTVPILFTSSVKGNGIGKLHSFLRYLPIPARQSPNIDLAVQENPAVLFHVDDTFKLPATSLVGMPAGESPTGSIVSGHLRHGSIAIGDELVLGPFSYISSITGGAPVLLPRSHPDDPFLTPRSFGDALAEATSSPRAQAIAHDQEWQRVKVISTRNLRMPVQALQEDQAGTVGLVFLDGDKDLQGHPEIRKGMVLTRSEPEPCAAHSFTASFDLDDASSVVVGSLVVIYCASVRESAKVIAVALENDAYPPRATDSQGLKHDRRSSDEAFEFDFERGDEADERDEPPPDEEPKEAARILVTLKFTTYRAWLECGATVLIMPGGGAGFLPGSMDKGVRGFAGFDGFAGRVVETFG